MLLFVRLGKHLLKVGWCFPGARFNTRKKDFQGFENNTKLSLKTTLGIV